MERPWRLLVFGVTGAVGRAVTRAALARGWSVVGLSRGGSAADTGGAKLVVCDPLTGDLVAALDGEPPFDDLIERERR